MNLGKYFTLSELTVTKSGLANVPNAQETECLRALVENILDPAREQFGAALTINSGYRSDAVNKRAGGSTTSQHRLGQAADIDCADNARLFSILKTMAFDQLIWEGGDDKQPAWVHVSYGPRHRKEVLKMVKKDGKSTYTKM